MRLLFLALLPLVGCATSSVSHLGGPNIDAQQAGYWIWHDQGVWHLRVTSGNHPHRFQGSVAGVSGGVTSLDPTHQNLVDRAALSGRAAQFDLEPTHEIEGIDLRVEGECARFDLLLDGRRRPDRVRLGRSGRTPSRVPFERCPR